MAIPTMGLRDIRTPAGRRTTDQPTAPYMVYMRIGALEMEKARREKERASALQRVQNIDTRIQEIEAETAALLEMFSRRSGDGNNVNNASLGPRVAPRQSTGGIRVRY